MEAIFLFTLCKVYAPHIYLLHMSSKRNILQFGQFRQENHGIQWSMGNIYSEWKNFIEWKWMKKHKQHQKEEKTDKAVEILFSKWNSNNIFWVCACVRMRLYMCWVSEFGSGSFSLNIISPYSSIRPLTANGSFWTCASLLTGASLRRRKGRAASKRWE